MSAWRGRNLAGRPRRGTGTCGPGASALAPGLDREAELPAGDSGAAQRAAASGREDDLAPGLPAAERRRAPRPASSSGYARKIERADLALLVEREERAEDLGNRARARTARRRPSGGPVTAMFFSRMRFAVTSGSSPPAKPITSRRPFQAMHFSELLEDVAADRVVDHVGAAAARLLLHARDEVLARVVDRDVRARRGARPRSLSAPPAVAITRAPSALPICTAAMPTPPAAACTSSVSPACASAARWTRPAYDGRVDDRERGALVEAHARPACACAPRAGTDGALGEAAEAATRRARDRPRAKPRDALADRLDRRPPPPRPGMNGKGGFTW